MGKKLGLIATCEVVRVRHADRLPRGSAERKLADCLPEPCLPVGDRTQGAIARSSATFSDFESVESPFLCTLRDT